MGGHCHLGFFPQLSKLGRKFVTDGANIEESVKSNRRSLEGKKDVQEGIQFSACSNEHFGSCSIQRL